MSRPNVETSLEAVEQALTHFATSLDRGGFAAGADAYRQMADVVVGQWLWVEEEGVRDLEPAFRRIAKRAGEVSAQLEPYVESMRRLGALRGLIEERWGVDVDGPPGKVVELLMQSEQPLTATEVRTATGLRSAEVRQVLGELVERELVTKVGDRRPRYGLGAVEQG